MQAYFFPNWGTAFFMQRLHRSWSFSKIGQTIGRHVCSLALICTKGVVLISTPWSMGGIAATWPAICGPSAMLGWRCGHEANQRNMKCSDLHPGHFQQQSASSLFYSFLLRARFPHGRSMLYVWHLLSILWDFFEICLGLKSKHVCFGQETYINSGFSYSLIAQPPLMLLCSTVRPKLFGVFCW